MRLLFVNGEQKHKNVISKGDNPLTGTAPQTALFNYGYSPLGGSCVPGTRNVHSPFSLQEVPVSSGGCGCLFSRQGLFIAASNLSSRGCDGRQRN
jgi:hypothetical protein